MSIPYHLKRVPSTKELVFPMRTSGTPQQHYYTYKLIWQITYSYCCRLPASLKAPGKSQLIEWKWMIILLELWGEIPYSWRTSINQESGWEMLTMLPDTDRQDSAELSRKSSLPQRLETEVGNKKILNSSPLDEKSFNLNMYMLKLFLANVFCLFTYSAYFTLCLYLLNTKIWIADFGSLVLKQHGLSDKKLCNSINFCQDIFFCHLDFSLGDSILLLLLLFAICILLRSRS